MQIRHMATIFVLMLAGLSLPSAAVALPASASLHDCSVGKVKLALDVASADRGPTAGSATESASSVVRLQLAEAAKAARGACQDSARASIRSKAARIASLYHHGQHAKARRLLGQLLAAIRGSRHRSPGPAHGASRTPRAVAASGCSFDGTVHISLHDVDGVADDLAAAAAAQLIGDEHGAEEAIAAAREDLAEWVKEGAGGAESAGDWMSVAAAAQWLGSETLAAEAMGHARTAAREALDAGEKLGPARPPRTTLPASCAP